MTTTTKTFINLKVMEELETIKTDLYSDYHDSTVGLSRRIDEVNEFAVRLQQEKQELRLQSISIEQDLNDKIRLLDKKIDEQSQVLQSLLDNNKEDNRLLFEQLRTILGGNSQQIELVSSENEKIHQVIAEMRARQNSLSTGLSEYLSLIHI
eukprot:TRINITY_DN14906_c0_g1_i1.p1 TRINITY_DN14906_c0_g1~~TRINITY_DN14906_c0_g1_i1.p1  ORF type:complete len:152 (-),score=54.69 TRINITY_DN14906_c0_g1_i1:37-492(-)